LAREWHTLLISAEAATKWIRKLLIDTPDIDDDEDRTYIMNMGTHSGKTTVSSWAAKRGQLQTRKIMGTTPWADGMQFYLCARQHCSCSS